LIGAAVVVALVVLVLPPIQIPNRISWLGCTALSDQSPSADGPDGLNVSLVDPGTASVRLRLGSLPLEKLPAEALKALPESWTPLGPLYQTGACGSGRAEVILSVPASLDASLADTVDLVSWDGKSWRWLGGHADVAGGVVVAQLDMLPPNVMAVQTVMVNEPTIGAELAANVTINERAASIISEFAVPGLIVSNDGTLQGELPELPDWSNGAHAMFAAVRNWATESAVNVGLVEDVLLDARSYSTHIKALTDKAVQGGYAGIMVDYRGIPADLRPAYTRFITDLAASLHKNKKQLGVVVPMPVQRGDEWDTAGYDWRAIGAAADVVQVDAPADPTAYTSRRVEKMLRWAVGVINRQKLQVAFPAASVKQASSTFRLISYEEALKPFNVITASAGTDVPPGTQVELMLKDAQGVEFDMTSRTYRYTLSASEPATNTVWINTGASLAYKLGLALRFNLRGVMLKGLVTLAQEPSVWVALEQYQAQALAAIPAQLPVVWTVRGPDGAQLQGGTAPLTNTNYLWTAPLNPGRYTIAAALPGSTTRGELSINVVQPTPMPIPTPRPVTVSASGAADKCLNAAFVADVTVQDGTQFDKNKEFEKTWRVRNNGTCDWPAGTVAAYASGEKMGAPDTVQVGAVPSGATVDITVKMKAPDKDGNFKATWRLMDDRGNLFGEPMTIVIVAGQPAIASAPPAGVPRPVTGGVFELGGHVESFSRPDLMKQAGMKWIKIQVHHGEMPVGWINDAHYNGFKILLGTVGDKGRVMSPAYHDEFAQWCAALAQAGADAIEVWNEPNIDHEWPAGQISGTAYTALLAKAYAAIKGANQGTLVISAALAPTGFFAGGCQAGGCNDDVFLAQMASAGAANYADCIGAHHNAGATSPSATSGHPADSGGGHYSWYFWPTLNLYYNAFGGARQVCFTEFGYLSGEGYPSLQSTAPNFAWAKDVTVGQQAAWLAEAASLSANSGKVRLMIIWNVDFTYYGTDPQAGYAIIRPGGSCPACVALGQVMGGR